MEFAATCYGKLVLDWHGPFLLCAEEVNGLPIQFGGVYLLSAFVPTRPELAVFYVGQSGDLQRRLGEHLSGGDTFARHFRGRLSAYFHVAAISDPGIRTATEAALITMLRPAGNEVTPRALPVGIELPDLNLFNVIFH